MFDLITIGDSLVDIFLSIDDREQGISVAKDHVSFHLGDKIVVKESQQMVGGNAANVAVGSKRLGLKTAIISEIGDDLHGHAIEQQLKKERVNTSLIQKKSGEKTRYSIVLNTTQERTILSYHPERKYTMPTIPKTRAIYYTSMGKGFDRTHEQLYTYLKKNKKTYLFANPGTFQTFQAKSLTKKIFPHLFGLIINKDEAIALVGHKQEKALLKALHALGPTIVTLTDGAAGSWCFDGTSTWHMPIYPSRLVAKTGAGDAYSSAFVCALLGGKSIPDAMTWGSANAASVIEHWGAQSGLCTKKALLARIKKYPSIHPQKISAP